MKLWFPLTLLTVIVILLGGIVFFSHFSQPPRIFPTPAPPATSVVVPVVKKVQVNLKLQPQSPSVKVGQEFTYDVMVDAQKFLVSGVEVKLNFDPQATSLVKLIPGQFLTKPVVLEETVDATNGTIKYALGALQQSTGSGTVFQVRMLAKAPKSSLGSVLSFDRENTKVGLKEQGAETSFAEAVVQNVYTEQPISILQ